MRRYLLVTFLCISYILLLNLNSYAADNPTVEKQVVIRFSDEVNDYTVRQLMDFMDGKRTQGTTEFIILISSPGGNVNAGLTAYNYLKGMPQSVTVTTHNFGVVDSIGIIMYCGGSKRFSVPQARFLLHGIKYTLSGPMQLDERSLDEMLKALKIDSGNIAKVISANTQKTVPQVEAAISEGTTLTPEQGKEWGLVHEIKNDLYDASAIVYHIGPPAPK